MSALGTRGSRRHKAHASPSVCARRVRVGMRRRAVRLPLTLCLYHQQLRNILLLTYSIPYTLRPITIINHILNRFWLHISYIISEPSYVIMLTGCVSVQKDLNTDITQARSAANDIVIASLVVCPLCEKLHDTKNHALWSPLDYIYFRNHRNYTNKIALKSRKHNAGRNFLE